jgi:hypothetical protein
MVLVCGFGFFVVRGLGLQVGAFFGAKSFTDNRFYCQLTSVSGTNSCPLAKGGSDSLDLPAFGLRGLFSLTESLILAQDERWRRA